ncbi:MAG: class I mannose-6-phosphate isomerase [Verrucomicrobia bacterium]|nr:class I mannose-6-phosphate isomerase [Verrucomicrobiota bacterium]
MTFHPIVKERIWGGRNLERLYQRPLPPGTLIGESWEISDRPEGVSVIANGPLGGRSLRWLMEEHGKEVLGEAPAAANGRFPLLVKILDAQEKLSLQVHPPAAVAGQLGGEPKTEMWYIAEAAPQAELFAGLKRGVTRDEFERRVRDGTVADCFHRLPVRTGDAMFLPSGRVHAIGAGLVIFEIQQNSDTTYRVFDWNRVGQDGQPRELHIPQALASLDFDDFEPPLIRSIYSPNPAFSVRYLVEHPLFVVNGCKVRRGERFHLRSSSVQVIGLLSGQLRVSAGGQEVPVKPGGFVLLPACLQRTTFTAELKCEYLHIEVPAA